MNEKISIIVPTYNNSKYLSRCLDSLLNQTYDNLEIIVVNDGSTDNTDELISKNYDLKNIKYFLNTNHGVSFSRNFGIKKSTGKYIMFLDGDDWLDGDYVKMCYDYLICHDLDIVKTGYLIKNDKETIKKIDVYDKNVENLNIDCIKNFLIKTTYFNSVCMQLIKKELVVDMYLNEEIICGEDLLFSLELLHKTKKVGYLYGVYYNYYFNNDSVTKSKNPDITLKKLDNIIYVINQFYNYDFSKVDISCKMFYEIEHYIRRYIKETKENKTIYKNKINNILQLNIVKQTYKNINYLRICKLYSIKRSILIFLLCKFKYIYLFVLVFK